MTELTGRMSSRSPSRAFAVIIAVNLAGLQAVSTFPGLEVKNSYVASQGFNAARRAQEALGWKLAGLCYDDGRMTWPSPTATACRRGAELEVLVGRTTDHGDDAGRLHSARAVYSAPLDAGARQVDGEGRRPSRPTGRCSPAVRAFRAGLTDDGDDRPLRPPARSPPARPASRPRRRTASLRCAPNAPGGSCCRCPARIARLHLDRRKRASKRMPGVRSAR
jgi:hypothetical protein